MTVTVSSEANSSMDNNIWINNIKYVIIHYLSGYFPWVKMLSPNDTKDI